MGADMSFQMHQPIATNTISPSNVLSPLIYGKSKKITLPLTYSDCDKYIEESNFDYDIYYLQTFKDDKIFGYHPQWKCEFKVLKAHLTHIDKKYISLISHIIDKF